MIQIDIIILRDIILESELKKLKSTNRLKLSSIFSIIISMTTPTQSSNIESKKKSVSEIQKHFVTEFLPDSDDESDKKIVNESENIEYESKTDYNMRMQQFKIIFNNSDISNDDMTNAKFSLAKLVCDEYERKKVNRQKMIDNQKEVDCEKRIQQFNLILNNIEALNDNKDDEDGENTPNSRLINQISLMRHLCEDHSEKDILIKSIDFVIEKIKDVHKNIIIAYINKIRYHYLLPYVMLDQKHEEFDITLSHVKFIIKYDKQELGWYVDIIINDNYKKIFRELCSQKEINYNHVSIKCVIYDAFGQRIMLFNKSSDTFERRYYTFLGSSSNTINVMNERSFYNINLAPYITYNQVIADVNKIIKYM